MFVRVLRVTMNQVKFVSVVQYFQFFPHCSASWCCQLDHDHIYINRFQLPLARQTARLCVMIVLQSRGKTGDI